MSIALTAECALCSGIGLVVSPEWMAWHTKPHGPAPTGPEEVPCHDCRGAGYILTDIGRAVQGLIDRTMAAHAQREHQADDYRAEAAWRESVRREREERDRDYQIAETRRMAEDAEERARKAELVAEQAWRMRGL